ncbi:MAG: substrate-binding domain-containing protein [Christensenellales bacterium]|jgi:ribose transport system substrate-binding protein
MKKILKKKRIHWAFLLLVPALAAAMLAGCGNGEEQTLSPPPSVSAPAPSQGEPAPQARQFAFLPINMGNPFYVTMEEGLRAALNDGDELVTFDSAADLQKEVNTVEDCINQGYDGIFLVCTDFQGSVNSVDMCVKAGMPVIIIDSGCENQDEATATVISNNKQMGYMSMKALAEALGGKGKVALYANPLNAGVRLRIEGRDEALAEYPDIEVVNTHAGLGSVDAALAAVEDFLQADPDLDGLWMHNDPTAQGACAAVDAAGKTGQILVTGIDGSQDGKARVKAGAQLCTAAQFPDLLGKMAMESMYKVLGGETLEQKDILVESVLIDKSNVDQYL